MQFKCLLNAYFVHSSIYTVHGVQEASIGNGTTFYTVVHYGETFLIRRSLGQQNSVGLVRISDYGVSNTQEESFWYIKQC